MFFPRQKKIPNKQKQTKNSNKQIELGAILDRNATPAQLNKIINEIEQQYSNRPTTTTATRVAPAWTQTSPRVFAPPPSTTTTQAAAIATTTTNKTVSSNLPTGAAASSVAATAATAPNNAPNNAAANAAAANAAANAADNAAAAAPPSEAGDGDDLEFGRRDRNNKMSKRSLGPKLGITSQSLPTKNCSGRFVRVGVDANTLLRAGVDAVQAASPTRVDTDKLSKKGVQTAATLRRSIETTFANAREHQWFVYADDRTEPQKDAKAVTTKQRQRPRFETQTNVSRSLCRQKTSPTTLAKNKATVSDFSVFLNFRCESDT